MAEATPRVDQGAAEDPYAYDAANGRDGYGHPVNGFGRCVGVTANPPTCPPAHKPGLALVQAILMVQCPRCVGDGGTENHPGILGA